MIGKLITNYDFFPPKCDFLKICNGKKNEQILSQMNICYTFRCYFLPKFDVPKCVNLPYVVGYRAIQAYQIRGNAILNHRI